MRVSSWMLAFALVVSSCVTGWAQVERRRTAIAAVDGNAAGVQRASCVLQLDGDPNRSSSGRGGIDAQTLNAMLSSTALVDPAAKESLGLGPAEWPGVAQIELLPAGPVAVKLSVVVTPAKDAAAAKLPENAAQKFLDQLAARAKAAVNQAAERQEKSNQERRTALEKELSAAQDRLAKIQAQLREGRQAAAMEASESSGRFGGGRPVLAEIQQLEVNLASQRARLKVIEEEIEKLAASGAATRPVGELWAELIAARERAVQAARNLPATDSRAAAVAEAEAELAEAKIRAATATASGNGSRFGGFDANERWQAERVTLRASIAEAEARAAALKERLPKKDDKPATGAAAAVTQYDVERLQQDEMRARQEVNELQNQLDQLRRDRRLPGPPIRLIVLDGRINPDE